MKEFSTTDSMDINDNKGILWTILCIQVWWTRLNEAIPWKIQCDKTHKKK